MTIPTCEQFSVAIERSARALAVAVAWVVLATQVTYEAGYALGRIIHQCNDWMAMAIHTPADSVVAVATAVDKALTPAPAPVPTFAQVLAAEGIKPLTPAELDEEIARFDAQAKPATRRRKASPRPAARRKSAAAPRVKTAG